MDFVAYGTSMLIAQENIIIFSDKYSSTLQSESHVYFSFFKREQRVTTLADTLKLGATQLGATVRGCDITCIHLAS